MAGDLRSLPPGVETLFGSVGRPSYRRVNMPANSKVARCVKEVKKKGGPYNPYAVCQASTGESYRTGKPPKGVKVKAKKKGK